MLNPIAWLIVEVINIYVWVVIAAVIVSWLIAFGVINLHNQFVRQIVQILEALTEPLLRRIRRIVPPISGLDISPLILLLVLYFIQYAIYWASARFGI
ncbi:MAG TPA: YggT family protein [Rhizomicrobium sp.]|jgi:YggT family protein|nr:YggT family protein [Rhizomicrobium sp.]